MAVDPTELAPTETETASVRAWGLDEFDYDEPPPTRLTSARITGAAVAVSLVAVAAAGLLGWQHLRTQDTPVDAAVPPTIVTSAPMTTTVVPVAAPEPKPPTDGWGVPDEMVPPPTKTVTVAPSVNPNDEVVSPYDARFVANLKARGWNVWNPNEVTGHAHTVCAALRNGDTPASVNQQMVTVGLLNPEEATSFTATAMVSYPNCP